MKAQPNRLKIMAIFLALLATVACSTSTEKERHAETEQEKSEIVSEHMQIEPVGEVDLELPPIPNIDSQDVSDQLDHIFYTDQMDRMTGTFITDTSRDSARLARVQYLYEEGMITNWEDKYKAAFVFIHSGGPFAAINSDNYFIASKLFMEVSEECDNPLLAEESKNLAETAINRYVNSRLFKSMMHDPNLGKNSMPFIHIEIDQS